MSVKLSSEQQAILEAVQTGANLLITAAAGSGKTFTLKEIAKQDSSKKFLYLAFNKSVSDEARQSMPRNVTSMTTHSFCRKVVLRDLGKDKVNTKRAPRPWQFYSKSIEPLGGFKGLGAQNQLYSKWCKSWISAYCRSDQDSGISESESVSINSEIVKYFIQKAISKLLDQLDRDDPPELSPSAYLQDLIDQSELVYERVEAVSEILANKICEDKDHWADFESWVKYCALNPTSTNKLLSEYDCVLIDEAQDTNSATIQIIQACSGIQKIWVGDEFQQIYAWRGAISAFERLRKCSDYDELKLTNSFRFGDGVADLANSILRGYYPDPLTVVGASDSRPAVSSAILCRTNAGVFSAVINRLKSQQRVRIHEGADLAIKVDDYFQFFNGGNPPLELHGLVKDWQQLVSMVNSYIFSAVLDFETIKFVNLINEYPDKIERLIAILPKCDPAVTGNNLDPAIPTVMTTHKAKGLEWDIISVDSDFSQVWEHSTGEKAPDRTEKFTEHERYRMFEPHIKALLNHVEKLRDEENEGKFDEEVNLFYVALTRSKTYVSWSEDVTAGIEKWNSQIDSIRDQMELVKRGSFNY